MYYNDILKLAYLLNRLKIDVEIHETKDQDKCFGYSQSIEGNQLGRALDITKCTCNHAVWYREQRGFLTNLLNQELNHVTSEERLQITLDHEATELRRKNEELLDKIAKKNEEIEKITGKPSEDVKREEANASREEFAELFCRYTELTKDLSIDELVKRRNQLTRAIALLKIHRHAAYLHEMEYVKKADYAEKQRVAELDKSFKPKEKVVTVKKSDNEKAIEAMMEALGMDRASAEKAFLSMRK